MIITADDLRQQLNLGDDLEEDSFLEQKIAAAESWVETYTGETLAEMDPLPAALVEAVLQLAAHYYVNREATTVGVSANTVPFGVLDLVRPYRHWEF